MSTATVTRNGITISVYSDADPLTDATYWGVTVIDAAGNIARLSARGEAHAHRIARVYRRAAQPGRSLAEIRAAARAVLKARP